MVFLLNEFSCGLSAVLLADPHMGIEDNCMVFLLNEFSSGLLDDLHHQLHMGI